MGLAHDSPVSEGAKLQLTEKDLITMSPAVGVDVPAVIPQGAGPENWYAIYTCPRHEKRVAEQIKQRSFLCFLPLYRSVRRWKDRRKELELALFPSYVFVRMALASKLQVLQLPGVVRIVSFNGQPTALPTEEMEAFQTRWSGELKIEPHPYLRVGRRVLVHSGPMQGLKGIIVRRKDCCRVIFSIDLIMRSVAVELDEADLEVM
jgi:transcription antitermination factor NusG